MHSFNFYKSLYLIYDRKACGHTKTPVYLFSCFCAGAYNNDAMATTTIQYKRICVYGTVLDTTYRDNAHTQFLDIKENGRAVVKANCYWLDFSVSQNYVWVLVKTVLLGNSAYS